ncbi:MAG: hypothetical protein IJS67_01490, partial [Clostridia bacterium]|nr:hypothetical protein [Clostridia bacterium]
SDGTTVCPYTGVDGKYKNGVESLCVFASDKSCTYLALTSVSAYISDNAEEKYFGFYEKGISLVYVESGAVSGNAGAEVVTLNGFIKREI